MSSSAKQFYDTHHPEQSALTDDLLHFPFAVGEEWSRIFKQVASCIPVERDNLLEALRTIRGNRNLTKLKCPVRFDKAQQVVMLWLCSPAGGGFLARLREQHRPRGGQWNRGAEEAVLEAMARVSPTLAERLRVIAWAGCTEEQKAVALEQYLGRLTDPAHHLEALGLVMKGNKEALDIATGIIKSMPTEAKEVVQILQATPASLLLTGWRTSSGVAAGINPGLTLLDLFPGELVQALKDVDAANRCREEAAYLCAADLQGAVPGLQPLLSAHGLPTLVADLEWYKIKPPVRWGTAAKESALSYLEQHVGPDEEEASLDASTASGSSVPAPQQELGGDEPQQPAEADAARDFQEREPQQPEPFAGAQAHRHAEMAMELLAHLEAVERDMQRWAQRLSLEMLVMMTAELLRSPTWGMPEWSDAHLDFSMPAW
ncbi:hypothetical protein GPECTOR_10g843 [Gonium pectorale]|uniref:Uncharacterized protein n=1 Tax=Gonium pectorale TaxID=33097 RepID=A0A150GR39_GONPE|nr:hypothetical protein GPECTOR_10g843 [Gonium pectorale]|eukprot:KXZ52212.1 hypothetical protein GPECTOR_10g843 [Gonium pectorale]